MRMTEIDFSGGAPIDGYGPGFFRVAGEVVQGNMLITPNAHFEWKGLGAWDEVLAIRGDIDVLFVGTGAEMSALKSEDTAALNDAAIAWDPMPTPAACRTYNVLLSEGRRVAAALLAV